MANATTPRPKQQRATTRGICRLRRRLCPGAALAHTRSRRRRPRWRRRQLGFHRRRTRLKLRRLDAGPGLLSGLLVAARPPASALTAVRTGDRVPLGRAVGLVAVVLAAVAVGVG